MRHEDAEELVPLLALDALSPREELGVRTHVEACRECAALLREHLETAADLALMTPPLAPPAGLKGRLMAQIAAEPQGAAEPQVPAGAAVAPAPQASRAGPSGPAAGRARWLRVVPSPRWRRVIGGLAAACVVLGVINFVTVRRLAELNQQIAEQRQIFDLVSGAPAMTMTPTPPGGRATGQVFVKGEKAAILLKGLDDAPEGVYEVWVIRDGKPRPLTTAGKPPWLKAKGQVLAVVDGGVRGAEGMAVSLEPSPPSPNAPGPRGPIVLKT